MKRCRVCNRPEPDDTLTFCRVDGTPLINESGRVDEDAGTLKFAPLLVSDEAATSILTVASTTREIHRSTGPITGLPYTPSQGTTHELSKSNRRKALLIVLLVSAVAIGISGYLYSLRTTLTQ